MHLLSSTSIVYDTFFIYLFIYSFIHISTNGSGQYSITQPFLPDFKYKYVHGLIHLLEFACFIRVTLIVRSLIGS